MEIRVKLLPAESGQDIHIPEAFALPGDEAILRSENGRLTVEAIVPSSLLTVLSRLDALEEVWPEIEDRPPEPVDF